MLFDRQKRLLALLNGLGGTVGSLDFQKLLFLYCQEENAPIYEFVPYKFGCFSFTSYADKRRLIERGFLADDEKAWKITPAGEQAFSVPPATRGGIFRFAQRHDGLRGDALVEETYRRYPYYAIHSEIAGRIFADDRAALKTIEAVRPPASQPGVATIGYEGRTLENYLNTLIKAGVTILCDVRRNPLSRKYGFSKKTLAHGCEGVGIRYEHLPELGIASSQRQNLKSQADYDLLFEQYERDDLPGKGAHLQAIRDWVAGGACVALTCYEREPEQCHRHCIADALNAAFGREFQPRHL